MDQYNQNTLNDEQILYYASENKALDNKENIQ